MTFYHLKMYGQQGKEILLDLPISGRQDATADTDRTNKMRTEGNGFEGISFNECRTRVTCLGEALLKIGIIQRDKVAVIGNNCRKWAIAYYSIVTSNCLVVPIDKDRTSEEIERIIKRARIRAIFFDNRYGEVLFKKGESSYGSTKR